MWTAPDLFSGVVRWEICVLPAGFVYEPVQSSLDLVVGEEGHVPGVRDRQAVPVPQKRRPRLHKHTTMSRKSTRLSARCQDQILETQYFLKLSAVCACLCCLYRPDHGKCWILCQFKFIIPKGPFAFRLKHDSYRPERVWWRCQTRRQRCSRCTWGQWWIWAPWPPDLSWWGETHGGPGETSSMGQWSCTEVRERERAQTETVISQDQPTRKQEHRTESTDVQM